MVENNPNSQFPAQLENLPPFSVGIESLANDSASNKLQFVNELEVSDSEEDLYLAGALCVEIASMPLLTVDLKHRMLDRAQKNWEDALLMNELTEERLGTFSGWSAVRLASLPLIHELVVEDECPSLEMFESSLAKMLDVGDMLTTEINNHEMDESSDSDALKYLRTLQAEVSVLLLLTRFKMNNYEYVSMLPVPTLFMHTGIVDTPTGNLDQPWDISIFTQIPNDQPFALHYRLRVRTKPKSGAQVNPLVVPVYVRRHLKIGDESKMASNAIIEDMLKERRQGDQEATERLDEREYRLLEVIG